MKADWVVMGGKPGELGHCVRCGKGLGLTLPQSVSVVVAAITAFVKVHAHCPLPAAEPQKEHSMPDIVKYTPEQAVGNFLKERLFQFGWSQQRLANEIGITVDYIDAVCEGTQNITPSIAYGLERTIGYPAAQWMNLRDDIAAFMAVEEQEENE